MSEPIDTLREAANHALAQADMLRLFEIARAALELAPDHPRFRYWQVLALARLGDTDTARLLYDRNRIAELGDEDALALAARLAKNRALAETSPARTALLREAGEAYRSVYQLTGGYYPLINAATLALLAGDAATARDHATQTVQRADVAAAEDYFAAATRAEALLLIGDIAGARASLAQAAAKAGDNFGMFTPTYHQLRLIAEALGLSADDSAALLAPIRSRPVIHYCGHLFVGSDPNQPAVAAAVTKLLSSIGRVIAFGALACGADIIIAEAVLAQGGELNVVLPFSVDDFVMRSVSPGGDAWRARFDACLARATSVTIASRAATIADDRQFVHGSQLAMGMALLRADASGAETVQVAILDRNSPASQTAGDAHLWQQRGGRCEVIDPGGMARVSGAGQTLPRVTTERGFRAILFADFAGYSKLDEADLPAFIERVLGSVDCLLTPMGDRVDCRNTWGDAVYVVLTSIAAAIDLAKAVQAALTPATLLAAGLPPSGGMRISLHYGPVYLGIDPVTKARTAFGAEVNLAARIEPRVPIGQIYVTQPFAAIARINGISTARFGYIGTLHLPKGFGTSVLYAIDRHH